MGIKTVAVYSEADEDALHVRFADEAIRIGPPNPRQSYLSISSIIAAGTVIFAGVNMRTAPRRGHIPPDKVGRYRNRRLGAGGIYVCIEHDRAEDSPAREVVSCYMHLQGYLVSTGEQIRAGETIGFVGHTGVRNSPPHLHLEVRVDEQAKNPLRYLSDVVIPPKATKTYHHVLAVQRARRRAARAAALSNTGI